MILQLAGLALLLFIVSLVPFLLLFYELRTRVAIDATVSQPQTMSGVRGGIAIVTLVAVLLPLMAVGFYLLKGNWQDLRLAELTDLAFAGDKNANLEMLVALQQKLQDHPNDVGLWMLLGEGHYINRDIKATVQAYEQAWDVSKKDATVLLKLVEKRIVLELGNLSAKTLALLEYGRKLNSGEPLFVEILALNAFTKKDYPRAVLLFQQALVIGVPKEREKLLRQGLMKAQQQMVQKQVTN